MISGDLLEKIRLQTKSSHERISAMVDALTTIDANKIEGDIVECGVWRGGNIILARKLSPHRVCWLYDTFYGMTAPTDHDGEAANLKYQRKLDQGDKWMAVNMDELVANLEAFQVYDDGKLRFVAGPVEQTLLTLVPDKIALLRLDTDWYASTKIELEVLYPLLQSGGYLIIDDYGHWPGAAKAVDDYFSSNRLPMLQVDYTCVVMVKP